MNAPLRELRDALRCIRITSLASRLNRTTGTTAPRKTRTPRPTNCLGLRVPAASRAALLACALVTGTLTSAPARAVDDAGAVMAAAISNYVSGIIKGLQDVADQHPTVDTFREQMKPLLEKTPGVFGASLIDTNFVIRKVYYRRDFLAVGFDLKKVSELDYFWKLMQEKPAPQLSEPAHGSILQPRLLAMRCPILADGQFQGIVSIMIHTGDFLKTVGLDDCSAYKITCLGKLAEEKGDLPAEHQTIKLTLPSTEWLIEFQK